MSPMVKHRTEIGRNVFFHVISNFLFQGETHISVGELLPCEGVIVFAKCHTPGRRRCRFIVR